MGAKILATWTVIVGAAGVFYALLAAFGVELSQSQQDAVTGVLGLTLVIAGIWLHPSVPIGPTDDK